MMKDAQSRTTYLKDYREPDFRIESTELSFQLYEDHAIVESRLEFVAANPVDSLELMGQGLLLEGLCIDGRELSAEEFNADDEGLTITGLSNLFTSANKSFILQCRTRIEPQNNTALEGLYKSKTMFCTQCEAEGFRRITYYLDRPDVMSIFTTTVHADKALYPILLSNGNAVERGDTAGGRHWVKWHDPFPKPSYLFALVAGDLQSVNDSFTTCSGREVELQIFVEQKDLDKCDHAMLSLKNAMRWDEQVYGREYDLDIFMIVAVDDFNMGAMENKGLNIFNTSCVLANPQTTTDLAFQRVEAVVAHEYFHNWSGNRVTCRDWFQLSLKEGFTVFRDSEFSADMGSRTVKRIEDVALLRTVQFAEDAGPMAHSIRPDSFMEISNFYTVTIYEKGAEVVRMISELLGPESFRAGSDLYFDRHDGQAVTTEDFVKAMEDASGVDLAQFRNWYSQAGTPKLSVTSHYDSAAKRYSIEVAQSCPGTPGQSEKAAFHIPFKVALLGHDGTALDLRLVGEGSEAAQPERVLDVKAEKELFVFEGVEQEPVPSLMRSFSAPVRLDYEYGKEQLLFLMVHDDDGFNRWNASQLLLEALIRDQIDRRHSGLALEMDADVLTAFERVLDLALASESEDQAMLARLLSLPAQGTLIESSVVADVEGIHEVHQWLLKTLALALQDKFLALYRRCDISGEYTVDAAAIGRRALKNLCLGYLVRTEADEHVELCYEQFRNAGNMTDKLAALRSLVNSENSSAQAHRISALDSYYEQWQDEPLVVDQWFAVQASSSRAGALAEVNQLLQHPAFEMRNPNKVRSVISVFCMQNHVHFHAADGSGYAFLADKVIELNNLNPQIASRLLTPLTRWKKYDSQRQELMRAQLQRVQAQEDLSKDVYEIVDKSLR